MKPHISQTQLESYCRCPEAYRRRYLEKEIIPPGIAAIKGTSMHHSAAVNFRQKIDTREDIPVSEFKELAAESFETAVHGGFVLSEEDQQRSVGIVLGEAKDQAVAMAEFHATSQAPEYQPILVEKSVRIVLPNSSRDLLGIIDLADDSDRVVDFKTSGKRKSQGDADSSVQLTVYAASFMAVTGRQPKEVRLDTIVQTSKAIDRDVLSSERGPADYSALAHRLDVVTTAIDSGSFPPATPGAWWCSDKWCGYWRTCRFVNSERRLASEVAETKRPKRTKKTKTLEGA